MSTLVSIMLAVVMEVISPTTSTVSDPKHSIHHIDVEEVMLYMEEFPTVTQIKNC